MGMKNYFMRIFVEPRFAQEDVANFLFLFKSEQIYIGIFTSSVVVLFDFVYMNVERQKSEKTQ